MFSSDILMAVELSFWLGDSFEFGGGKASEPASWLLEVGGIKLGLCPKVAFFRYSGTDPVVSFTLGASPAPGNRLAPLASLAPLTEPLM